MKNKYPIISKNILRPSDLRNARQTIDLTEQPRERRYSGLAS